MGQSGDVQSWPPQYVYLFSALSLQSTFTFIDVDGIMVWIGSVSKTPVLIA